MADVVINPGRPSPSIVVDGGGTEQITVGANRGSCAPIVAALSAPDEITVEIGRGPPGLPGPGTSLSWDAATRTVASDTGTDAVITLVTSTNAGLAPSSGGGTTSFLRADGTWATPSGGGGFTDTFETVSKNLSASDATITYAGGNIDEIAYANGINKNFTYGVDGLETIVLSGATPGGIDLTKTLQYTLGEFTGFAYS